MSKHYPVIGQVKHDGKRYGIGSSIELTDEQAEQLMKAGVVDAIAAPAVLSADERLAAIIAACAKLDPDNVALYIVGGVPKTEVLAAITGWPVSSKERDAAWAEFQAGKK